MKSGLQKDIKPKTDPKNPIQEVYGQPLDIGEKQIWAKLQGNQDKGENSGKKRVKNKWCEQENNQI